MELRSKKTDIAKRMTCSNWKLLPGLALLFFFFSASAMAQPAAPTLASPSNGSTGVAINPTTLSWYASTEATSYELQVSTDPLFGTTVYDNSSPDTFQVVSSVLSNNILYYWRVEASDGGPGGWSGAYSFTTIVAAPPTPTLSSPTNGLTGVSISLTLSWNASAGAATYELQVSTDPTFTTTFYDNSSLTGTSQAISGLSNNTLYYWRVDATNAGGTSGWSTPTWSFTTIVAAPPTPTLSSPTNGLTGVSISPTLSWNASAGAATYELQVSTSSTFATTVYDNSTLTGTSQAISGLSNNTPYYWRVDATNAGGTSGWSTPTWSFTTIVAAPPTPTLSSPTNGLTGVSISPTLSWNASAGAATYELQVSTDPTFTTTFYDNSSLTGTSQAISGLSNNTLYYWRVDATNAGGTSGWSTPTWSFTTIVAAPPTPTLSSPTNGLTGVSISPTLSWNASAGAATYELQVSTSSTFATTVYDNSTLTGTSQAISGLSNNTPYYWRVDATNAGGTSGWSTPTWSFTTIVAAPPTPTLSSPTNGLTGVSISPTLSWNASAGAATYELQVSTSSTFATTVYDNSTLTGTSQAISGLSNNTPYYWRVDATNAGGTSGWSTPTWSFMTIVAAPVLLSPANGSTGVSTSLTLSWNPSAGATSYELQVSTSSSFGTTVYDNSSLTGTSQVVSGLSNNTLYYWRVSASNAGGTSGWSTVWNFTTIVAAPVLLSPANGSTGISTSPVPSWNASAGATSYELQVSTSSSFGTTVYDNSSLTGTSQVVSGLSNGTLYYWRVSASNAGGTSGWSTVWNFTTIVAPPSAPVLASPANGSTGISASPTLSWNAAAGAASYGLQVSTDPNFGTFTVNQTGITGTNYTVSGLSNGTTYYWRVDATNSGGTSGWSTAWNFTTTVTPPSAPVLASPADSSTGSSTSPTLSWNAVAGAASYDVQVSTDSSFGTFAVNHTGITGTNYAISGLSNGTTYYWRVDATNSSGASIWSAIWNFTTTVTPPSAPVLASPANGSTGISTTPTLSWNVSAQATSYEVQVSTDSTFATTFYNQSNLTTTSKSVSGLSAGTKYYWRVDATNSSGTSGWSAVWNFTTTIAPPVLLSPANGSTGISTSPTLSWNAAAGATSYEVQVSTDSTFAATFYNQSNLTTTSKSVSGLSAGTKYYWRVDATNSSGTSGWSAVWNFTTTIAPPVLLSPANGSTGISTSPTLSWNAAAGAASYELQVSTDSTFAATFYNQSNLTTTSESIGGLSAGTKYYWRVDATNSSGTSGWSAVWNFTTIVARPPAPVLASPANGSTGISASPTLSWNAAAGAASYGLQVSTDPNFGTFTVNQTGITGTNYTVSGLSNGTTYYWRVDATNSGGTSGWSTAWNFTTTVTPPSAPVLASPADSSTGSSTSPTLSWNAVAGAASYDVQVSTDSSFGTFAVNHTGITGTNYAISGLSNGTTYYWRVDATNSSGASIWSAIWNFTTTVTPPSAPVLASPANGSTGISTTPTLSWNVSAQATSYEVQVSTDSTFATTFYNQSNLTTTSKSVSGLSAGTKYYWRVDATNSSGTSGWSAVWNFTTTIAPPVLLSPANGSTGISTSPTLSWNAAAGATSYEVQVSTDSTFAATFYNQSNLTTTSKSVSGLSAGTKYYWRVDATNSSGTSGWSAVWNFTTTIAPPVLLSPANGSTGISTSPTLSWNAAAGATSYEVQVSTDSTFAATFYNQSNLTTTSESIGGLSAGTEYYWRVNATNSSGMSGWSTTWSFTTFTYPSSISVSTQYVPPSVMDSTSYQIIGLPGAVDVPIANLLSGKKDTDWKVYYDNGADQNYYVEYNGTSAFDFQPGRAFWILSRNPFSVSQNASTVPLDTADSYSIDIHSGWNLISNPFEKSVNWASVQAMNGTTQPIWTFSNGSYSQPLTLDPYRGYYFYNDIGTSLLRIPYVYSSAITSAVRVASVVDMNLIVALSDGNEDLSSITVGVKSAPGTISANIFAPPGNFERVRICVVDSTIRTGWKELVRNYRDTIGTGQQFDFYVKNRMGNNLKLNFDIGQGLSEYQVYLIDKDLFRSYNLMNSGQISIPSYSKLKNYSILVGDKAFVDAKLAELLPKGFQLYQNYPNPFNPVTVIRFEVPKAERVSLIVYDVLGRKVENLMNTNITAGYYEIPFDGSRLASGVYFYRLSTGSFTQVKKMVLLK